LTAVHTKLCYRCGRLIKTVSERHAIEKVTLRNVTNVTHYKKKT